MRQRNYLLCTGSTKMATCGSSRRSLRTTTLSHLWCPAVQRKQPGGQWCTPPSRFQRPTATIAVPSPSVQLAPLRLQKSSSHLNRLSRHPSQHDVRITAVPALGPGDPTQMPAEVAIHAASATLAAVSEWTMGQLAVLHDSDPAATHALAAALQDLRDSLHLAQAQLSSADGSAAAQRAGQLAHAVRETFGAFLEGLQGDMGPLDAGKVGLQKALGAASGGPSRYDPGTVLTLLAFVAVLIGLSVPRDSQLNSGASDDVALAPFYDPVANAAYWQRRPVRVLSATTALATELARLAAAQMLDAATGQTEEREGRRARQLRKAIERLGPAYIKIAQVMATRVDVVPEVYIAEIVKLQDRVAPFPSDEAARVMARAFGAPPDVVFEQLGDAPIAAASLGQVYQGKLRSKYGGDVVAVKVLRPGILEAVSLDIYLLRRAASVVRRVLGDAADQDWEALLDEWAYRFFREVDFNEEAANMERFRQDMSSVEGIKVPECVSELSSESVLVTRWVDGKKMLDASAKDLRRLCDVLLNAYLIQLLETGFLHADPHPGNLIRTPDGRVCVLDYGLMTEILPEQQPLLVEFLAHLAVEDWDSLVYDLQALEFIPSNVDPIKAGLLPPITIIFSQLTSGGGARGVNIDAVIDQLNALSKSYPFRVPPRFLLILRAFSAIEGIGLRADFGYSFIRECFPYVAQRILSDDDPRMQALLKQVLYGNRSHLDISRLERLATAFTSYTTDPLPPSRPPSTTQPAGVGPPPPAAASADPGSLATQAAAWPEILLNGGGVDVPGSLYVALTGRPNEPLLSPSTRQLLKLVLSERSNPLQDILVREMARALDAVARQQALQAAQAARRLPLIASGAQLVQSLGPLRPFLVPFPTVPEVLEQLESRGGLTADEKEGLQVAEGAARILQQLLQGPLTDGRADMLRQGTNPAQLPVDPAGLLIGLKLSTELSSLMPQLGSGLVRVAGLFGEQLSQSTRERLERDVALIVRAKTLSADAGQQDAA